MDWLVKLTGFREERYGATRSKLAVDGNRLRSNVNGATYDIGNLELVSLACLREALRLQKRLMGTAFIEEEKAS